MAVFENVAGFHLSQEAMESSDFDIFGSQQAKTSPIRQSAGDFDLSFNDGLVQSPISMPIADETHESGRLMDVQGGSLTLDDLVRGYDNAVRNQNMKAKMQEKPKAKRASSAIPIVFHPFVSVEATELTVHELRSALNSRKTH